MVFAHFLAISPRKCFKNNSIDVRSCFFFLSRSLCLRLWVDDVVCFVSLSSLFVQETKLRSNRTPHPPALAVVFLVFFSPPLCFVSPVLAVRPFCSGVSSGCHSGPRAFFGFSRDSSEAFFLDARRQRRVLVFWSVVFPVLRLHTFLVGLAPGRRKAGPRVVSPAPPARVRVGGRMPFSGGGTKTPSCLVSFCF